MTQAAGKLLEGGWKQHQVMEVLLDLVFIHQVQGHLQRACDSSASINVMSVKFFHTGGTSGKVSRGWEQTQHWKQELLGNVQHFTPRNSGLTGTLARSDMHRDKVLQKKFQNKFYLTKTCKSPYK